MHDALVSVVLPAYNCGKYISEALESALRQTYAPAEIIVVDDGSTDDTGGIIEKYAARYPGRIRYLRQPNRGPSAARNAGIRTAKGEYIAFLDADDVWLGNKLECQIKEFTASDTTGLVTCGRSIRGPAGMVGQFLPGINALDKNALMEKLMIMNVIGGGSSVIVRKKCFDAAGLFDESLRVAEDWDMWLRICERFACRSVDAPLIRYRMIRGSQSDTGEKNIENELLFLNKTFDRQGFKRRWYLRSKSFSYRYGRAAWAFLYAKDRGKAREYILKAFLASPLYFISGKGNLGLLVRILFGDRVFHSLRKSFPGAAV